MKRATASANRLPQGHVSATPAHAITMFFTSHENLTDLCRIMARHGSDKGAFVGIGRHNYTLYYHRLFAEIRGAVNAVFELGIGSTRADIPYTMGAAGTPGASLRGWREYFPNANIYAADIDRAILQPEYRILKFFCDQADPASIAALWNLPELGTQTFDIIIEDGLHEFEAQYRFMKQSLHKVRENGVYICEDVRSEDFDRWKGCLRALAQENPARSFEIVTLDNPHHGWNSLIVVR